MRAHDRVLLLAGGVLTVMALGAGCGGKTGSSEPAKADGTTAGNQPFNDSAAGGEGPGQPVDAATECGGTTQEGDVGGGPSGPAGCDVVRFGSTAIEQHVRMALSWTHDDPTYLTRSEPFTGDEVLDVTQVNVDHQDVDTLEGVDCLRSLETISLYETGGVRSLEPLAPLTELRVVIVDGNIVTDLSPLSGKEYLRAISANDNQISDLSSLILPAVRDDAECGDGLGLLDNPVSEEQVARFCELGWQVAWGISGSESTPYGDCNTDPCRLR